MKGDLWLKVAGITLVAAGVISIGISAMAIFIISAPSYSEVQSMKSFYGFCILLGLIFGILNCVIGINLFNLKRKSLYAALIISALMLLVTGWFFLKGFMFFPINILLLVYLGIFIITLFAIFNKEITQSK